MMNPRHVLALAVCLACLVCLPRGASADDSAVTQRLQSHGGLAGPAAKRLQSKVSQRLQKAADTLASATDPVRVAMSQALYRAAVPPDNMAAAKLRLKLYAGLNEANLDALFLPKPGAISACVRSFGATQGECEALVAAAGRQSVADARSAAGGPPVVMAGAVPPPAAAPAPAPGGGRFGSYNSGFAGRATFAATPAAQPATTRFGGAAPAPAAQPAVSQKQAYQAQREAYLARQRQQQEERKSKLNALNASAPAPDVARPASEPAPVAAAKPAPSAKGKAAPVAAAEAPAEEAPVEEPVAANSGPALDGDFLNGLLADPLGGK
jgi:hypothetical protein